MSNTKAAYPMARVHSTSLSSLNSSYKKSNMNGRKARMTGTVYGNYNQPLRGPALAEHIFGTGDDYLYMGESDESQSDFFAEGDDLTPENFQYSLPLESVEELEGKLRQLMRKYELSLERMGQYALAWHFLQEEVEDNAQVRKMFNDMQLVRKLSGGNTEGHL